MRNIILIFTLFFGFCSCFQIKSKKKQDSSVQLVEADSNSFQIKNDLRVNLLKDFPSNGMFADDSYFSTEDSSESIHINMLLLDDRVKVSFQEENKIHEKFYFYYKEIGSKLEVIFKIADSNTAFLLDLSNSERSFSSDLSLSQLNGFQIYESDSDKKIAGFRKFGLISNREIIKSHLNEQEKIIFPLSYFIFDKNEGVVALRYLDRWYYRFK